MLKCKILEINKILASPCNHSLIMIAWPYFEPKRLGAIHITQYGNVFIYTLTYTCHFVKIDIKPKLSVLLYWDTCTANQQGMLTFPFRSSCYFAKFSVCEARSGGGGGGLGGSSSDFATPVSPVLYPSHDLTEITLKQSQLNRL